MAIDLSDSESALIEIDVSRQVLARQTLSMAALRGSFRLRLRLRLTPAPIHRLRVQMQPHRVIEGIRPLCPLSTALCPLSEPIVDHTEVLEIPATRAPSAAESLYEAAQYVRTCVDTWACMS